MTSGLVGWSNGTVHGTDGILFNATYLVLSDNNVVYYDGYMFRYGYKPTNTGIQPHVSPSHCNAIKKDGKACNCKVKYPSTDRCGRHVEKQVISKNATECGVCYEKKILVKLPNCTHELCKDCNEKLPRRICPYCRCSL
jgi:hypothetical protein